MGEINNFEFNSSQESLPLSQETFELIWNDLTPTFVAELNNIVGILPSSDAIQVAISEIKQDEIENLIPCQAVQASTQNKPKLDSCDLNNERNEQESNSSESALKRELIHHVEQVGALAASIQVPQLDSTGTSSTQHAPSSLPASETWPGQYRFTVSFAPQEKNTKGVAWTYSKIKDKLYVGKDAPCPINFSVNTSLPNDVFVRVMALYTSPEQVSEVVHRCVNHSMEELRRGVFEAEHLVRCESFQATYEIDSATHRHSVVVPFENPPVGQHYSTYIYKFLCFGSCAGGPNRRPLMLIFTLERGNQVIGRRKLDIKICACPGRDRKIEESQCGEESGNSPVPAKRKAPAELDNLSDALHFTKSVPYPAPKKTKVTPSRNGLYNIEVADVGCYEFLVQMKKFYEMCGLMKGISPEVARALLHYQKKNSEKNEDK